MVISKPTLISGLELGVLLGSYLEGVLYKSLNELMNYLNER